MSAPVIVPPLTPRVLSRGVAFTVTLTATETPTSWAATGLPAGLAIDNSGVLSGTPTGEGLSTASITATNDSGTSAAVQIVFDVRGRAPGAGAWDDVEIDFDLDTGLLSLPGHDRSAEAPLLRLKKGDKFPVLLGIRKGGVLQRVDPDSEPVDLKLGIKEFEPERLVELSAGTPERTGATADETRYRIPLRLTPQAWQAILDDYEDDGGTEVVALAELQLQVGAIPSLYDETESDTKSLSGGISSSSPLDQTLTLTGLAEYAAPRQHKLTLKLEVAGRPSQTVQIVRELLVGFSGENWTVSEISGAVPAEVQGAVDGTNWRATLKLASLAGSGTGVAVGVEVTTTEDTGFPDYIWHIDTGVADLASAENFELISIPYLALYDGTDTQIGTEEQLNSSYADFPELAAHVETLWEGMSGASDIVSVTASGASLVVAVAASTAVRKIYADVDVVPAPEISPTSTPGVTGIVANGTVTARLEQLEIPDELPYSRTSQTDRIAVARDMVPD